MKITENYIEFTPKVKVRKYKIDEKAFQQMMREYKQKVDLLMHKLVKHCLFHLQW